MSGPNGTRAKDSLNQSLRCACRHEITPPQLQQTSRARQGPMAGAISELRKTSGLARIRQALRRAEVARGFLLLSPAMGGLLFARAAPNAPLAVYRFWTHHRL